MGSPPGPTTDAQPGAYRWYVLALLTLTSAFSVADRLVFGILVEDIKAAFALSDFELDLLGGLAFSLVYVLAGLPAARLADRSTRKNIVAAAMSGCISASPSFWAASRGRSSAAMSPTG